MICVLFADNRFLPVHGLHFNQLTTRGWIYLVGYSTMLLVILGATYLQLRRWPVGARTASECRPVIGIHWVTAGRKLLVGCLIIALTVASYSLYCLQFY